tara:strand:- start:4132 stop:5241 length:1110 start_codon:yes stop_codon:yes gene_type:complete
MKYSNYSLNEEHRRILNLMGTKPNVISEQKTKEVKDEDSSKFKEKGKEGGKIKIKAGKGDKDYKLIVTRGFQFDPNNLNASDMVFKMIQEHQPIASAFPDLTPEQILFSTRKDGKRRDVFTFMVIDKQLPPEKKEEEQKKVEELVKVIDVEKEEVTPEDEVESETAEICNLRGDTKWEYKVENEEWYTRKRGTTKWIKLGGDKFIKARRKLDKGCPGFRKTREKEEQKQEKATLQEGCSEKAIKEFHTNMMTEVNGTGNAGGTADGFVGVVEMLPQFHKYYCKCMTRNNYEALDLEVSSVVMQFQEKWKTAIGCGNDTKPTDDVAAEVDEPVVTQPEINLPDFQPAVQDNTRVDPSYLNTPNFDLNLEY